MAGFRILLDELGIETVGASCTRSRIAFVNSKMKVEQFGAIRVVPISAQGTTSGSIKGAAWGIFLAGPLGAAVGSMVGGGMKVAFELHTLEGEVFMCLAGKSAYLDIKRQVETRPAQPKGVKAVRPPRTEPRGFNPFLTFGMLVFPVLVGLFYLRDGHTWRGRAVAAVWTLVW